MCLMTKNEKQKPMAELRTVTALYKGNGSASRSTRALIRVKETAGHNFLINGLDGNGLHCCANANDF